MGSTRIGAIITENRKRVEHVEIDSKSANNRINCVLAGFVILIMRRYHVVSVSTVACYRPVIINIAK